jgi:hemerythrin-like domain-containing protein
MQATVAEGAPAADFAMLRAAVFYLGAFPERLHHPREEQTLFKLLRERAPDSAALLDTLQAQHREGAGSFERLRAALAAYERVGATGRAAFAQALAGYAQLQWTHMALEEQQVLPAASQHLQPADWLAIATAFESHDDPRFDLETEAGFANVFKRLMDLAARSRHDA